MKESPYGSWRSPITSDLIVGETVGLGQIVLDGRDIYWSEIRPSEGGRSVIVRRSADGQVTDLTPPSFNARTRVHEYGGGDFAVADGTVYFSNFSDQRLYRQVSGKTPEVLTREPSLRFADGTFDRRRQRLFCVCEDHGKPGEETANKLVSLGLQDGNLLEADSGNDFYSSPCLSPDSRFLAWLTWNHPNMPWDGTELWVGELDAEGKVIEKEKAAGGEGESIFQPQWSPEGILYFVSDRSGWWNLYRRMNGQAETVAPVKAEFGMPQWIFGMATYAFVSADNLVCAFNQKGLWRLARIELKKKTLIPLQTPFTEVAFLCASAGHAFFLGGSPTLPKSMVDLDLQNGRIQILRTSTRVEIDPGYLAKPEAIEFPTENGLTAHAFYYRPRNKDFKAPEAEKPPLLVISHGGPTAAATSTLNFAIQYWTSRGFAVADVNYGGSAGYGRAYRERLNGKWGVVDVEDCVNAARFLVKREEVDGSRLAIRGGSAGGYTTLCALTFRDVFKAGASHYGVSDLEALTKDTHKFESRYLDRLIGPYPGRRDLYRERSPIHFVDRLSCPVIFFQGNEDKIVPPDQAEKMAEALRTKGLPVAYILFEGEQHGFRRAENIKRALDAEIYFYSRIFGFALADPVGPVEISNFK